MLEADEDEEDKLFSEYIKCLHRLEWLETKLGELERKYEELKSQE